MVTQPTIDTDTVALSDLAAPITMVQVTAAASREHATAVEAVSQQEQATTTSRATTTLTDLIAALAAL
jgi:hypothetical protein